MEISEKQKNILLILRHITKVRETSAAEIADATGLSFATISRALGIIKKLNLTRTLGRTRTEMIGRRPEIIALNNSYGYLLHFYVDVDNIRCWLVDFSAQTLDNDHVEITRDITPDAFSSKLGELARKLFKQNEIPFQRLMAASMAVPGMVDEKNKRVCKIPNLYRLQNVNLFAYAQKALGVPVLIANEARMCVLGEYLHGTGRDSIVYIDITKYSGIGAGILLGGRLFTGSHTIAGELGDIFVGTESFEGDYNEQQGCLETVAGLDPLFSRIKQLMEEGKAQNLSRMLQTGKAPALTLSMIEMAAEHGDRDVLAVYEDILKMWCIAIINVYVVLDPQVVILGGVLNTGNAYTLERMQQYLRKAIHHDFNLRLSSLGEIAQLRGGIHLLENYVFKNIITTRVLEYLDRN